MISTIWNGGYDDYNEMNVPRQVTWHAQINLALTPAFTASSDLPRADWERAATDALRTLSQKWAKS